MYRMLVVEDKPNTLEALTEALKDYYGDAEIDPALSVEKAMESLDQRLVRHEFYDVVVLDFRLPKQPGLQANDIDVSVCERIDASMPGALVVHVSSYMNDAKVRDHILEWHVNRHDSLRVPAAERPHWGFAVPKEGADWVEKVCAKIQGYLISRPIREELQRLLAPPQRFRLRSNQMILGRLTAICRRIAAGWPHLDPGLKEFVRKRFVVVEGSESVEVRLPN